MKRWRVFVESAHHRFAFHFVVRTLQRDARRGVTLFGFDAECTKALKGSATRSKE